MYIGERVRRREDGRFLTGNGRYVDDVADSDAAHIVFVRSAHAHARIVRLNCERAGILPGVLRIVTAADWKAAGLGPLAGGHSVPFSDGRPMNEAPRPPFAVGKVRHVGEIIAAVVAMTHNQALDAAEAVEIEYDVLPVVTRTEDALDDACLVHEEFGTNLATEIQRGNRAATQAVFARAAHITALQLPISRVAPTSIEPQCYYAKYDVSTDETLLWATSQMPHRLRQWICHYTLGIPQHKLRVIAPDIGGSFGVKGSFIPEASTVVWMARELRQGVKWRPTRSEAFLTDTQGRDHVTSARMAFDKDGVILGLEIDTIAALGAYAASSGAGIPTNSYPHTITGLYRTPSLFIRVRCVYTNTLPVAAYRGSGRPEAAFVNERLLENGAREMGIDVVEMRRRNFIQRDEFPYRTPVGRVYDCGDPPLMMEKLVRLSGYEALRAEQLRLRDQGLYLGIGLAAFLDKSGTGPSRGLPKAGGLSGGYESATVRALSDGKVELLMGCQSQGQSHETTFTAIAADRLGISIDDIRLIQGDTGRVQFGNGTWGSRSVSVGGSALYVACAQVMAKARRIAAHMLDAAESDVSYDAGLFLAPSSNRRLSFAEIAGIAYGAAQMPKREGFEPGLEFTSFFDPTDLNDPMAIHLATVIVDGETGLVSVRDYFTLDDCGVVINPLVVEGQIHGGLVQGIGQALMESVRYDSSGQLLSGSLMDYAVPRAQDVPSFALDFHETPAPSNPLGVKGGSESGVIGPPAAIVNAVVDAFWHLGIRDIALPLSPNAVWTSIRRSLPQGA